MCPRLPRAGAPGETQRGYRRVCNQLGLALLRRSEYVVIGSGRVTDLLRRADSWIGGEWARSVASAVGQRVPTAHLPVLMNTRTAICEHLVCVLVVQGVDSMLTLPRKLYFFSFVSNATRSGIHLAGPQCFPMSNPAIGLVKAVTSL